MQIKYINHAAFFVTINNTKIIIDPYNVSPEDGFLNDGLDFVLLTHAHSDHLGNCIQLANHFKAHVLCVTELAMILSNKCSVMPFHISGTVNLRNQIKITMVPALHSSSYVDENGNILYAGPAVGYIINDSKVSFYHAGDTGYMGYFKIIKNLYNPDVVALPIGGHYCMDLELFLKAVDVLEPKTAIAMHFNTFPSISIDENKVLKRFSDLNKGSKTEFILPKQMQTFEF